MNKVTIEFFHDVICSFCFPMSYRMRQIQKLMPEVQIVHRSYALVKSAGDFDLMFGSRTAAKDEIMSHWEHANHNDDMHRFNISGMRQKDFQFPSSMKGLVACKAAYFVAGDAGYWDLFDALQNALFVENRNIEEKEIITDCVRKSGIDFAAWEQYYNNQETKDAVERDFLLVKKYNIQGVPALVINGNQQISGAQPLSKIIQVIEGITKEKEQPTSEGAFCRLVDGKFVCE
ncbi:DsbA family protein [Aminobacterium sp. EBM-42]|uniref:DsbA family oxidoreductase n=1 Tax=Aminobacterium sp. EBM-42 TaxID=1918503 RepID=UPI000A42DD3E|nr:DsbA family protein [Aminobacterium sp. EBM-42]NLD23732.1 DsbA family protein [Bacteroidales bacterium]